MKPMQNCMRKTYNVIIFDLSSMILYYQTPINISSLQGSSVDLACAASGNPPPTIVWTKRNRDLAGLQHRLYDTNANKNTNANTYKDK